MPDKSNLSAVLCRVVKKFGNFTAVDDISMEVRKSEIFGFLGPNGAGKTTTIKILCGLVKPTSGECFVDGIDVGKHPEAVKKRIGYMSQKFSLYEDLKVTENIDFYGGIYGVGSKTLKEKKKWILEMADLAGKENLLTKSLPLGWKQRLALGCAVIHDPSILFLDEPTSGVDPLTRRHFWDLIYALSDKGVTVFVTTHYMSEADYCHRLALIDKGSIKASGTPNSLKKATIYGQMIEFDCDNPAAVLRDLKNKKLAVGGLIYGTRLKVVIGETAERKDIINFLDDSGYRIGEVRNTKPSLEDVFITVTGTHEL